MKVILKKEVCEEVKNIMGDDEYYFHSQLLNSGVLEFYVYSVLISNFKCLYLIRLSARGDVYTLVNQAFFDVVDPSVSEVWVVKFRAHHNQMRYFDFDFRDFFYLGIPKFIYGDFYEQYHSDEADAVCFMDEMRLLIEGF